MRDVDALLPFAESGRWATHGKGRLTLGESGGVAGGLELFGKSHSPIFEIVSASSPLIPAG